MTPRNVLKPALSRGEIQCIGATTLDEYRKYIEKDAALERRFQTIIVEPPSKSETVEILKGLRDRYEAHHRVHITDGAIETAVELANRYITGRFLPDKAIDVIDEGGRARAAQLDDRAAGPEGTRGRRSTGSARRRTRRSRSRTSSAPRPCATRPRSSRRRWRLTQKEWRESMQETDGIVDEEVVADVVSRMTGVPLTRLESHEAERLLKMEDELHHMVVSQHEAIHAISRAVRRSRAGLKNPNRPVGCFIFLGPTGVGKTLLARALAKYMFGAEDALVQIDMSEYMEKHNVSRLVGAPPGYVGYEEGGQLTEKIRRRPYSVVLLDEIEKAHSDVFNMLLQIMEDGRLTDSFGRKVDFRNTILIMTSNIGADVIKNQSGLGFRRSTDEQTYDNMKKQLMEEIDKHFRPEFLNRLDDVIVFRALTKDDLRTIVNYEFEMVRARAQEKSVDLRLSPEAAEYLIEKGYSPDFGARPLRRVIEREIEDPLSEDLLRGVFLGAATVTVGVKDGKLTFDAEAAPAAHKPAEQNQPAS